MLNVARSFYWLLSQQLGIDPRRFVRMPFGLWRYLNDLRKFRRGNTMSLRLQPCLHDWWEQAGALGNEYFWQDLFVAKMIHSAAPPRHIDVGSRLDGFVAHLAAFREVEVFDVRHLAFTIPGVTFRQVDMMNASQVPEACVDSVSCLHAIEHFGLGRYGDPLEPRGVELGLAGLARMLAPEGLLYLSAPVGNDVVRFNAHRSLHPATVARLAAVVNLQLQAWWLFDATAKTFELAAEAIEHFVVNDSHSLAIYVFRKAPINHTAKPAEAAVPNVASSTRE